MMTQESNTKLAFSPKRTCLNYFVHLARFMT